MYNRLNQPSFGFARLLLGGALGATMSLVALGAPSAGAATHATKSLSGVVVATNHARHTVVIADVHGAVHTLRLNHAARPRIGTLIKTAATSLADGTWRASSLHAHAHATSAHVRATVVRTAGNQWYLSADNSVFRVQSGARVAHDSSTTSTPTTGTVVDVTVSTNGNEPQETSVTDVGQTGLISLEGTLSTLSTTSLAIAVEDGPTITVNVPSAVVLPTTFQVGDRVEAVVDFSAGTFTLVNVVDDSLAATQGDSQQSNDGQGNSLEVEGLVSAFVAPTSAAAGSLTITNEDQANPIVLSVPSTIDTTGVVVGARVHANAVSVGGVLTVSELKVQSPEGGDSQGSNQGDSLKVEGLVSAFVAPTSTAAGSLTITSKDQANPVVLSVPSTIDTTGVVVGAQVEAKTVSIGGVLTVSELKVKSSGGGDSQGTNQGSTDSQGDN